MAAAKKIELWEGYEVTLNEDLMDDFDFVRELNDALKSNDLGKTAELYFDLIGGETVYEATKAHLVEKTGHFSIKGLREILQKIDDAFPKAGQRV